VSNLKLARAMLRPINTTGIIILGVYTFLWGIWIANPWWSTFNRAALYSKLDDVGPEWLWGVLAMVCAVAISYGAIRPSYRALIVGSLVGFLHWTTIAFFYFLGDWQNTGGITAGTFATYAAFIYLNVRVNHKRGNQQMQEILS
jgi:hypothetical protein